MASDDEDGTREETTLGEVNLKKGATVEGTLVAIIGMLVVITVGKVGCALTLGDEVDVTLEESVLALAITFVPTKEEEEETLRLVGENMIECTGVRASDDCCPSNGGGC